MTSAAESITESLRRTRQLMVQVSNMIFFSSVSSFFIYHQWSYNVVPYGFVALCVRVYRRLKEAQTHS